MTFDAGLPYDERSEQALLGTILYDPQSLETISNMLKGDEFYFPLHNLIFKTMCDLADKDEPIDLHSISQKIGKHETFLEAGSISYLSSLTRSVTVMYAKYIEHYVKKVKEAALRRELMAEGRELHTLAAETEDPAALLARMRQKADTLSEQTFQKQSFRKIRDVAMESMDQLERIYAARGSNEVQGVASGFPDLDHMTAGFQRSDLIIVGARPSVGKTAFALNIAQNVGIRAQETVAIFSLEMSAPQLVLRMVSAEGNVDASRMRTGHLQADDWEKITLSLGLITGANIFIDDSPSLTVHEIRSKSRALKKEHGLGLILIDYLQLIQGRGKGESRQQEVSEISRTLKQIARELEVPVIALSQLSRSVEQRQDKRPMLSDLRESGSIEQDADIVAFLYRDDYYDKETEKKNIIEIIIAKQRNGPTGTVELAFMKNFNKFASLDRSHAEQASRPVTNIKDKKRQWPR